MKDKSLSRNVHYQEPMHYRSSHPGNPPAAWANIAGYAVFVPFLVYFMGAILYQSWWGDFRMHVAALSTAYGDLLHPPHEAVQADGSYSTAYTSSIIAFAALGKILQITPYQAMQLAALLNLSLYAASIVVFFRVVSGASLTGVASGLFLVVSLFLRSRNFDWSSETSYLTLSLILGYPSLLGWALALFVFSSVELFIRTRRPAIAVVAALLLVLLLLNHLLTGSWVIGIVIVRGIALWIMTPQQPPRETRRTSGGLALILVVSIVASLAWPYWDLPRLFSLTNVPEGGPFGEGLAFFTAAPWLYVGALASLPFLWKCSQGRLLILYWVATAGAFFFFKLIHIDFGMRYAFFVLFYGQVMLALGITEIIRRWTESGSGLGQGRMLYVRAISTVIIGFALAFGLGESPNVRLLISELAGNPLPRSYLRHIGENAADRYYRQYPEVVRALSHESVVLMDARSSLPYDIRTLAGASSVAAPLAFLVPDHWERVRDVGRFLEAGTPSAQRTALIARYQATHILLGRKHFGLSAEFEEQFGEPILRTKQFILFDAIPGTLHGTAP